jgi:hypothetical protein
VKNVIVIIGFDSFVAEVLGVHRSGAGGIDPMRDLVELKYRFCSSGHGKGTLFMNNEYEYKYC